ncbi:MAG: putative periplasmic membrane protein [uncultured Gemmatimonadetes bacterium]|uniref:Putative periplasmic membrane protein n=1 Tax=uncultured Gemmatimonadota bacterium TaxID=203437 RepID=A0A6J4L1G2_9BACT|nr:MAG: putative periplasmic membrane protein [uncultured Gemmatimonadota bacterium]
MTPPAIPAKPAPELPVILFEDPAAWAAWLEEHHADAPGVWLRLAKKDAPIRSLSYAEALDEALCYGWIDSQKKSWDGDSWIQKFTPRGKRSLWSRVNRDKVAALAGRMKPAGLREVERAKEDGRWDAAYDSQRNATVPDDFQAALDADPAARDFFATLNGANRYAVLFRIQTAKKPETRARRIETLVAMLARNEKIHA